MPEPRRARAWRGCATCSGPAARCSPRLRSPPSGSSRSRTISIVCRESSPTGDEPAAGLDETETTELGNLVRRLAHDRGMAVLLIEHDMSLVLRICTRVVVLDFGHKIAEGTPSEIRGDPAVIAAYLGEEAPVAETAIT
jgi:ABC-type lipopolysaccharide export system ATPase subunit